MPGPSRTARAFFVFSVPKNPNTGRLTTDYGRQMVTLYVCHGEALGVLPPHGAEASGVAFFHSVRGREQDEKRLWKKQAGRSAPWIGKHVRKARNIKPGERAVNAKRFPGFPRHSFPPTTLKIKKIREPIPCWYRLGIGGIRRQREHSCSREVGFGEEGVAMATIKELADKLEVSPQTIRRFVKKEFGIIPEPRKPITLDANQCNIVAAHFATDKLGDVPEVTTSLQEMLQEIAILRERVAGLERENELLRERLKKADEILEREQMQARGFWSRLGQRMLGNGQ